MHSNFPRKQSAPTNFDSLSVCKPKNILLFPVDILLCHLNAWYNTYLLCLQHIVYRMPIIACGAYLYYIDILHYAICMFSQDIVCFLSSLIIVSVWYRRFICNFSGEQKNSFIHSLDFQKYCVNTYVCVRDVVVEYTLKPIWVSTTYADDNPYTKKKQYFGLMVMLYVR